jgi:hypothetical protein
MQTSTPPQNTTAADTPVTAAPQSGSADARATLAGILGRVGAEYSLEDALRDAAGHGFVFRFTWADCTTLYEQVWEHPAMTAYNARLDMRTAAILDSGFFALYQLREGFGHLGLAPFTFVAGQLGNTACYEIWPSDAAPPPRGTL